MKLRQKFQEVTISEIDWKQDEIDMNLWLDQNTPIGKLYMSLVQIIAFYVYPNEL